MYDRQDRPEKDELATKERRMGEQTRNHLEDRNRREHVRWIREEATDAEILMLRQDREDMRSELGEALRENARITLDPETDYDDYDPRLELVRALDLALHGQIPAGEEAPAVVWEEMLSKVRRLARPESSTDEVDTGDE